MQRHDEIDVVPGGNAWNPKAVSLPDASHIAELYAGADLADAYSILLPSTASHDVRTLARFILGRPSARIRTLLRVRDLLVAGFGIKTSTQLSKTSVTDGTERIHLFRVYSAFNRELVLGEDDKHLDFRCSVLLRKTAIALGDESTECVVTTVVHCHNRFGRTYLWSIAPFHRMVIKSALRRGARRGWPTNTEQ